MNSFFKKITLLFLTSLTVAPAFAQRGPVSGEIRVPLWVDLQDIVHYRLDLMPDAKVILDSIKSSPRLYAPDGAVIQGSVAVQDFPVLDANSKGITYGTVTALMKSQEKGRFFRFFQIHIDKSNHQVTEVKLGDDIPLSKASFTIRVGLVERMLVLNDIQDNIEIIYPLGVGGIDPGLLNAEKKNRFLTPLFSNAKLERKNITATRHDPSYYREQPFMPITNQRGLKTPIGFHITILSDEEWAAHGGSFLVRGFDSHGCMRLRQKDLTELFTVVMNGASDAIPVDVSYFLYGIGPSQTPDVKMGSYTEIHPYPLNTSNYAQVKNVAAPGEPPRAGRDPDEGLVFLESVAGEPDLTSISGFSADDLESLKVFRGLTEANRLVKKRPVIKSTLIP